MLFDQMKNKDFILINNHNIERLTLSGGSRFEPQITHTNTQAGWEQTQAIKSKGGETE